MPGPADAAALRSSAAGISSFGLREMVTTASLVTMSGGRWNIAAAKAGLSRLVVDARARPQVIENRGRPVAVVLSTEEYERLARGQGATDRWRAVLDLSAEIRDEGGTTLDIPARTRRASPFGRTRG